MRARLLDTESEVLGPQTGVLCNLGQSGRPDLFAIVKAEREISVAGKLQLAMRADLLLECPSKTQ